MKENESWIDLGDGVKVKVNFGQDLKILEENTPILDWEGLEENGKPLPYFKEDAIRIMKEYPHFADYIWSLMGDPFLDSIAEFYGKLKERMEGENK